MVNESEPNPADHPSMPAYEPLYPDLPIHYTDFRRVSVFCKATERGVRELLPDILDYESNEIEVFLLHAPNVESIEEYWEGGVITRASFRGRAGGYMAAEFVTNDAALAVGREIHGHPKKLAEVEYDEREAGISGSVARQGQELFSLEFRPTGEPFSLPDFTPRFHDRRIPSATGPGYDLRQILEMELSGPPYVSDLELAESDPQIHRYDIGTGDVSFPRSVEPFHALEPLAVLGASFVIRDFDLGFTDAAYDVS